MLNDQNRKTMGGACPNRAGLSALAPHFIKGRNKGGVLNAVAKLTSFSMKLHLQIQIP